MSRLRTLIVIAGIACFAAFGVAEAQAEEWAGNNYYLSSGQNGFLNHHVWLYVSQGEGLGGVLSCAGIRGVEGSLACETKTETIVGYLYAGEFYSEPYLHNHSTFGGYFRGWWF